MTERGRERRVAKDAGINDREKEMERRERRREKTQQFAILSYCASSSISNEGSTISVTSTINKR